MDDPVAARLELVQQRWQTKRGCWLDVVQQQDAAAARFKTIERPADDFAGADARPVVGHEIHAPGHIAARGEIVLDGRLPQQARNAEKSGDAARLAERGADRCEAVLDLARGLIDRHPGE